MTSSQPVWAEGLGVPRLLAPQQSLLLHEGRKLCHRKPDVSQEILIEKRFQDFR